MIHRSGSRTHMPIMAPSIRRELFFIVFTSHRYIYPTLYWVLMEKARGKGGGEEAFCVGEGEEKLYE
jgi:hypothetical protein